MKISLMKKLFIGFMLVMTVITLFSCTSNQRAKNWGGSTSVDVPAGEVFVNATWKDANLWVITYNPAEKAYKMHECSEWGILQGTVTIHATNPPTNQNDPPAGILLNKTVYPADVQKQVQAIAANVKDGRPLPN